MEWNKLISEIKETGLNQAQIASAIDVSEGTLSEWNTGDVSDPRWSKGNALIALHAKRCKTGKRAA